MQTKIVTWSIQAFFSIFTLLIVSYHSFYLVVSIKYVNSFVFITLGHIHIVFPKLIANARNKSKIRIEIQKRKKKPNAVFFEMEKNTG